MTGFALFAAAVMWGFIGQRASDSVAAGPAARMRLAAPEIVRGGLFFQSRERDQP
jgi:hypothetical protein